METTHYVVTLAEPLCANRWFAIIRSARALLKEQGVLLDEFGDAADLDREAIRKQGKLNYFEGFISYRVGSAWPAVLRAALTTAGAAVKSIES